MDTRQWRIKGRVLTLEKPLIMGVLNVTPDSFSDGNTHNTPELAADAATQMLTDGADIIDIGGESTRPGAAYIDESEEMKRVILAVHAVIEQNPNVVVSIDTRRASVAREALAAGASIINDISAFEDDEKMPDIVRETCAGCVLMHKRGVPMTMQRSPEYNNVTDEVRDYLKSRIEFALSRGIKRDAIAIDPGFGFGKTTTHNLELLATLCSLSTLGAPVLAALSRKKFIGDLTDEPIPSKRLAGTLAANVIAVCNGASIVRVHDVKATRQALAVASEIARFSTGNTVSYMR